MTKDEAIAELERLVEDVGNPTDNTNRGMHKEAEIVLRAMSLLADLKGWKIHWNCEIECEAKKTPVVDVLVDL